MRLLNTATKFLENFTNRNIPDYVILSHRWSDEEITFDDITKDSLLDTAGQTRLKRGYGKLEGACAQAQRDGYEWIWIDSCCIDKSSSAELQESINSMWHYYEQANICYAYLEDIPNEPAGWGDKFKKSKWWTRGWTLQELLAPMSVEFYSHQWSAIGTKSERYQEISGITHISQEVLTASKSIHDFCAAEKFSWTAHREVTRDEDEAYALLGLFDVNMPLIYGEGRIKAFCRLQEAIYAKNKDSSIFLFRRGLIMSIPFSYDMGRLPLVAHSPSFFCSAPSCPICDDIPQYQCLPKATTYASLRRRTDCSNESHDPLNITVIEGRVDVSATFEYVKFREIFDRLEDFGRKPVTDMDHMVHVALLNYTLDNAPKYSALCLLLFEHTGPGLQAKSSMDTRVRMHRTPVLAHGIDSFAMKTTRHPILVRSGISNLRTSQQFEIVATGQYSNLKWIPSKFASPANRLFKQLFDSFLRISIGDTGDPRSMDFVDMECDLHMPSAKTVSLSLRLYNIRNFLSIEKVIVAGKTVQHARAHTDRCNIELRDGSEVQIALRRMGFVRRNRSRGPYRYNLTLKYRPSVFDAAGSSLPDMGTLAIGAMDEFDGRTMVSDAGSDATLTN